MLGIARRVLNAAKISCRKRDFGTVIAQSLFMEGSCFVHKSKHTRRTMGVLMNFSFFWWPREAVAAPRPPEVSKARLEYPGTVEGVQGTGWHWMGFQVSSNPNHSISTRHILDPVCKKSTLGGIRAC